MIEFKYAQAEGRYVRDGWDGHWSETKYFLDVLAELVNDGWQIHTVDMKNDKALMEREV